MNFATKVRTYWKLGWRNLAYVGLYRIALKVGVHPVQKITPADIPSGDFYSTVNVRENSPQATPAWTGRPWAFGQPLGEFSEDPPDWHMNLFTGAKVTKIQARWDKVPTFSEKIGDVKTVWEASRFDWVLAFAQDAARGKPGALAKLNRWLNDWATNNPAYKGPNWICGQEASIRVAHLVVASMILDEEMGLLPTLDAMLLTHLRRIAPTTAYARGQSNNHATSEGMALYIGGLFLLRKSTNQAVRREVEKYVIAGRRLMERCVRTLIFDDGGFSQYSFVYHRLMLDSLSLVERFRRIFDDNPFSSAFLAKAKAASGWLRFFVNPDSGDVPNMGSNDGAWLLPVGRAVSRDFRPSCALSSTLFEERTAFSSVPSSQDMLRWLGCEILGDVEEPAVPPVKLFPDSGIVALTHGDIRLFMRLPGTRYRPHQADALHVDLWHGSVNLLSDAGTYSYAEKGWEYFQSTAAHNTVQYDARDQMPRVSRFLFGDWLKREKVTIDIDSMSASASYTDSFGCSHERTVSIITGKILITDKLNGRFKSAAIRWRILDQYSRSFIDDIDLIGCRIETTSNCAAKHYQTRNGYKSLYYYRKTNCQVLNTQILKPGTYTTEIEICPK